MQVAHAARTADEPHGAAPTDAEGHQRQAGNEQNQTGHLHNFQCFPGGLPARSSRRHRAAVHSRTALTAMVGA